MRTDHSLVRFESEKVCVIFFPQMADAYVLWRLKDGASIEKKIQNKLKSQARGGGKGWGPPRDFLNSDSEEGGEDGRQKGALHSDSFISICWVEKEFHLLAVCMG